jgi:hypothetical protein
MPSSIAVPVPFPYTFPFTFGALSAYVDIGDYEPVLPIEYRYTMPSIFGGTDLDQLFDEADLTWYSQPATLMPEYYPRDLYGFYTVGESGGNWVVMQLSTPIFLPNGTAVSEPTHTRISTVGTGRTSTRTR